MRKFSFSFIVLIFLTLTSGLFAQSSSAWWIGKPIVDIQFEGIDAVDEDELEPIVRPFIGEEFSNPVFWDLQSRLYALDYFQEIVPNSIPGDEERNSVIILFEVVERPELSQIDVIGNQRVRTNDILDTVLLSRGDLVNNTKVRTDAEAIQELYLERGFTNAEINWDIEVDDEDNTARVIFDIAEGAQTTIRNIEFVGNDFASAGTLRGVMETKQQSLFNNGIYQENVLETDRERILTYYKDNGYVDAEILDILREYEEDENASRVYITLVIYITEGEQYNFGGIEFEGNTIFDDERLQELVRQRQGSILNASRLAADFQRVADLYYENGYIYNEINMIENRDEETNTISYTVQINEQNRAHIENVIIRGNDKTEDYVILREIPLNTGDVFSKSRVIEAMQNLYNLQYFSNITPETPFGSVDGLMDLVFNVEEDQTAQYNFGVTFSGQGEFPLSGLLKWSDRNFLGRGQTIGAEINASPVQQSLSFNFLENWLAGIRWSGGINFSIDHSLTQGISQDIMYPIFSEADYENNVAVPDPYDGHYVYTSDGDGYSAGDAYPGIPTQAEIDKYNLKTDYQYAVQQGESIPSEYLMSYDNWSFSLGLSTGYRFNTLLGNISLSTNLSSTLGRKDYDPAVFRPYDPNIRNNRGIWSFVNKWSLSSSLDSRDIYYNPSTGYLLNQSVTFTGGFLFGDRHYIRTETKAESFFTLLDIPVSEIWDFKLVLGMHSSLAFMLSQFDGTYEAETNDELYIDGMNTARGWDRRINGRSLWNNWIELRMPLAEQLVWLDGFFDCVGMWGSPEGVFTEMDVEDFLFDFGLGLRFTIPQFPIRLYLSKRFRIDNGQVQWSEGTVLPGILDMDPVITIGLDLF
ncbi:MAG: outer membrane protein assembly factor BamA [Spirochaetia bacterium]